MELSCKLSVLNLHFLLLVCIPSPLLCSATSSNITQGQTLRDGETLLSTGGAFELGFFAPNNDTTTSAAFRYLGIWYNLPGPRSFIWMANRERPLADRNGSFTLTNDGSLVLSDGENKVIWSTNALESTMNNSITAVLEDTGNFKLSSNVSSTKNLWQSFDHPTDTFVPGMEAKVNPSEGGEHRPYTSWKSTINPSPGNFSMGIDPRGAPQIVIWRGLERRWRSGHWNQQIFLGVPSMPTSIWYGFDLNKGYLTYTPQKTSDKLFFKLSFDGYAQQVRWLEEENQWKLVLSEPSNNCDFYNTCGDFGVCRAWKSNSTQCSCIQGFLSRKGENSSDSCLRKTPLKCSSRKDGFLNLKSVKLPDFADVVQLADSMSCEQKCLENCSCIAYADVSSVGCMTWTTLVDVQQYPDSVKNPTLYVRLARSDLLDGDDSTNHILMIVGILILSTGLILLVRKESMGVGKPGRRVLKGHHGTMPDFLRNDHSSGERSSGDLELPLFDFSSIAAATQNFSETNKLGQGGFGCVYKGLVEGQEVAVKRLSTNSGQGTKEFTNEAKLIARLQHRNLVRLIGCCVDEDEKMLVYEYLVNRSLDSILFDETKRKDILTWRKRVDIVMGIARGLLYLHQDSRLRIVHRDLKAGNILLDSKMNPKISDFGTARMFRAEQTEEMTRRVIGTFGYMSPEYAMRGHFSVKSDVFSFGVLVLEIVSGRKNSGFHHLLGHAWKLWNEGNPVELLDALMEKSSTCMDEVMRYIQVGLLCVQRRADDRPTMSTVLLMLSNQDYLVPKPKIPGYVTEFLAMGSTTTRIYIDTSNDLTVTDLDGR